MFSQQAAGNELKASLEKRWRGIELFGALVLDGRETYFEDDRLTSELELINLLLLLRYSVSLIASILSWA